MKMLRFGPGGIPLSTKERSTFSGIERIRELGLDCMEIEFVHGVNLKEPEARRIGKRAQELDIRLSAHGPYYINLASLEKQKIGASRAMLVQTARACSWLGADRFTFHAAFYQKRDKSRIYEMVKEQIRIMRSTMDEVGLKNVRIDPELTGKATQFGDLGELIALAKEIKGVQICIDFAHAQARSAGEVNGYEAFAAMLQQIRDGLGQTALDDMHIHMSGINFTAKGERNHLPLADATIDWQGLLRALKDFSVGGLLVCESPDLEGDAMRMKEFFTQQ